MTTRLNGTGPDPRAKKRLAAMLKILVSLDAATFRAVIGNPDATVDEILEAMHRARLEHPGVSRSAKAISRRYLDGRVV